MENSKFEYVNLPNYLFLSILRIWARITAIFFFRKYMVTGREHIPRQSPVIFAVNHQSAFLDPVLIGISCGRKPWYLTRAGVFKKGMISFLLKAIHMLPVYRPRDKVDIKEANQSTFEQCMQILEGDGSVLIFPEGNHGMQKRLRTPLRKGLARIILDAERRNNFELGIRIVPVGINYEHPTKFRTDVLINFGKSFPISDLDAVREASETDALNMITRHVERALSPLMIDIHPKQEYDQIERVWQQNRPKEDHLLKRLKTDQQLITDIKKGHTMSGQKVDKKPRSWFYLIAGFPLFIYGILANFPLLLLVRFILRQTVIDPHFRQSIMFVCGMVVVPLFSFLVGLAGLLIFHSWVIFWIALIFNPIAGIGAYDYYDQLIRKPYLLRTAPLARGFLPSN